jgi:hypothetical protein
MEPVGPVGGKYDLMPTSNLSSSDERSEFALAL